jgi:Glycosyl hydrolase family 45
MMRWMAWSRVVLACGALAACVATDDDAERGPHDPGDGLLPTGDAAAAASAMPARDSSVNAANALDATAGEMPRSGPASADGGRTTVSEAGMDSGAPRATDAGRDARTDSAAPTATTDAATMDATLPPIGGGCQGWSTRYWDCCKPHCGWSANVSGTPPLATCSKSDQSLGSDFNAASSCEGGGAHMCHALAPWAVSANLSYGFAAIAARGDICGKCYQLQFTGRSHNAGEDPGSAAIAGKTMVVQATNVGGDVGSGQFDLLIPGGGVGKFNACSSQWGVSTSELGAQLGGFLTTCKQQGGDHAALKDCVLKRCTSVFQSRGLSELDAGCRWFVDWFQVADNPALVYKEVPCPQELKTRGMNRSAAGSNACGV